MTSGILIDDHAEVGGLLKALDEELSSGAVSRAFALLDLAWARLGVHIRAEHLCLFPAILDALKDAPRGLNELVTYEQAESLIVHLRDDHNFFMTELASAIKIMRELTATPDHDSVARRLAEVRQKVAVVGIRLKEHNLLEEERLYRWPSSLLTEAEQAQLLARMQHEIENLPPRFIEEESR